MRTSNARSPIEQQLWYGWPTELGGHGHELNGHRCPCPRHGHGRGMDTKFLEKRGVYMDVVMKKSGRETGVHLTLLANNEETNFYVPVVFNCPHSLL